MQLIKNSEKLIIWMHRNNVTIQMLADTMSISRQYLSRKINENSFTNDDLSKLKALGFDE